MEDPLPQPAKRDIAPSSLDASVGAAGHLTLDEAGAQALQAMAQVLQQHLPDLAIKPVPSLTLETFLSEQYAPWAGAELRGRALYVERIRGNFSELLDRMLG